MVFAVEALAALHAVVFFVPRMDDSVQAELLFALEGLETVTQVRSLGVVRLFVACQMVFALKCRVANLANESTLHVLVADHVLIQNLPAWTDN